MQGDQLSQQYRVAWATKAIPNGPTVAEIGKREEAGIRPIYRDLEALQATGFPLYTERGKRATRRAFIDIFRFKISPLLSRKAAMFSKKNVLNIATPQIYLVQFNELPINQECRPNIQEHRGFDRYVRPCR